MSKNLKGKECGKGFCQRKDGKYAVRYTGKDGFRKEKHFDTLPEARNTKRNYRERYCMNIQPVIGTMRLCDVKQFEQCTAKTS